MEQQERFNLYRENYNRLNDDYNLIQKTTSLYIIALTLLIIKFNNLIVFNKNELLATLFTLTFIFILSTTLYFLYRMLRNHEWAYPTENRKIEDEYNISTETEFWELLITLYDELEKNNVKIIIKLYSDLGKFKMLFIILLINFTILSLL